MKIIAEVKDKTGAIINVKRYNPALTGQVMELFREGYPDSFDGNDLRQIKKIIARRPIDRTFLVAMAEDKICGCLTGLSKIAGPQRLHEIEYIYVAQEFRHRGIMTIIEGIAEEMIKDEIRVIFAVNSSLLPKEATSFGWFKAAGFELIGEVKGYFRDDLGGLFLGKRNPCYMIGRGIPKNSGWDETMTESKTGRLVSEREYRRIMYDPGLTPPNKWGLDLIGRENVVSFMGKSLAQ